MDFVKTNIAGDILIIETNLYHQHINFTTKMVTRAKVLMGVCSDIRGRGPRILTGETGDPIMIHLVVHDNLFATNLKA